MKYPEERIVAADYTEPKGNPFLESMLELLDKNEFEEMIQGTFSVPHNLAVKSPQDRRNHLSSLMTWFQPMDYMYSIYDLLYRAIQSTYQTKNTVEAVRQLNQIYMDFRTGKERSLPYATQAYSGAILGVSGIGKTSTIQRCLSVIPQVIIHTKYQEQEFYTKQINYLKVECPSDCSVKTLAFNILVEIDRAIGSDYFKQAASLRHAASSAITTRLKIICMNHHVGLIVIDEIQNPW